MNCNRLNYNTVLKNLYFFWNPSKKTKEIHVEIIEQRKKIQLLLLELKKELQVGETFETHNTDFFTLNTQIAVNAK